MKHVSGIKKTVLAASVAATMAAGLAAPSIAVAEVSGTVGVSNMYFWRGQDLTEGNAQVFGSLDYAHSTGLYAGIWGSSELGGTEYDLYAGYAGSLGDFSYDIAYVDYNYPNSGEYSASGEYRDLQEVILSLGYAGFSAAGYFGVGDYGRGDDAEDNEDNYFTVGYAYDKYGITVGTWDFEADDTNYTHVDLSYALTDELGFTVSKVVDADELSSMEDNDDTLFVVTYALSF